MLAKPNAGRAEKYIARRFFPGNAKKSPANRSGRMAIICSILQKPFCGALRPIFDTSPFRSALR